MKKVSIVIPTFQRCESIMRLLTALALQTFPHDDFEVIVSIDGSEDGTREMVEQFSSSYQLRALWERNSGRASACNRGLNVAEGNIVIILDDDMEPSPELVQAHYTSHKAGTNLGVMGAAPIYIDENSTLAARYIAAEFNDRLKKISEPSYKFRTRDFYSANFSINREVLIAAGAFNESFKVYGYEDRELAHRLVGIGVNFVYNRHALCEQHYENDFRELAEKRINAGRMSVLLVKLHPEAFHELRFPNYRDAGWKWQTLRLFLIHLSILLPMCSTVIITIINNTVSIKTKNWEKIYTLALDYFFWLGAWIAMKDDDNSKQLLQKIKSYKKSKIDFPMEPK